MLNSAKKYLNGSKPHPPSIEDEIQGVVEAPMRQYSSKSRDKTITEMVEEAERTRDFYLQATRQANDLYQSYTAQHASIVAMLETNMVQIEHLKQEYTRMYQAMMQRPLHTDKPVQEITKQVKKLGDEQEIAQDN